MSVDPTLSVFSSNRLCVWGAGLIDETHQLKRRPRHVYAVRGPLTRRALETQGIEAPPIYGDPALLFPRYYRPAFDTKFRLGIVPHYVDKDASWVEFMRRDPECCVIDVTGDVHAFVDQICQCERVVSSSLHGVIVADAYGVPSLWIELSDAVRGGGFKFRDYYSSIGVSDAQPVRIRDASDATPESLAKAFVDREVKIDLDLLLEACPFFEG